MTYAYDDWVQLPTRDIYDTQIMAMAVNAAKDMYDRGQEAIKDFNKTYGDFMSPFGKDMRRYGEMMGTVRNIIDDAYSRGIDLTKSAEGRALIQRAINSVNPAEYNMMRANAKVGYQYLDAAQKLRQAGKYSEAQELFDIAQTNGVNFNDFATLGENGFNTWDRSSPIEAISLRDLTYNSYANRTARDLTKEDLLQAGIPYDSRYKYTGYLDSDLMKVAPGAALSISQDPRAAFFRNEAENMVKSKGLPYTQADVDEQYYRNIADANKWALIDPVKSADDFALENLRARHNQELEGLKQQTKQSTNYDGSYIYGLSIDAMGANIGLNRSLLTTNPRRLEQYQKILNINNAEKQEASMSTLKTNLMIDFLNTKSNTGRSPYQIIMSLDKAVGSDGRKAINGILSSLSVSSNNKLNEDAILSGFSTKLEDGTYELNSDVRVLSPQELLANLITHGSGEFKQKENILAKLRENEGTTNDVSWAPDWFQASTKTIASRTTIVSAVGGKNTAIVVPDQNGINRLYIKVKSRKNGFGRGDHNNFWVETPITYSNSGTPTSDNSSFMQASDVQERKEYSNASVTSAFENRR